AFATSLCPPILDCDGTAFGPPELAQPLHESGGPFALGHRRALAQKSDGRQPRRLRARRERPRCCRPAEGSQQFPPSDGDCHTPPPCEVRKGNDTTSRACCP